MLCKSGSNSRTKGTDAVGKSDPSAKTAMEVLASRLEYLENKARNSDQDAESKQEQIMGLEMELSELQAKHEQLMAYVETLQSDPPEHFAPTQSAWPDWTWPDQQGMQWPSFQAPPGLTEQAAGPAQATEPAQPQHFQIGSPEPEVHFKPECDDLGASAAGLAAIRGGESATAALEFQSAASTVSENLDLIPNERWKCLTEVPTFDPKDGAGTPWELGLRFDVWKKQFHTLASNVHPKFAEYLLECFKRAQERHDVQAEGRTAPPLLPVTGYPATFESRLVMVLLRVLPEGIKTPALEADEGNQKIYSMRLLEELYLCVRPGGLEEQQTLVRFMRQVAPVATAREAIELLRRWRLAKNRIAPLALPDVPAYEQINGIQKLLRTLEKKYDSLRTRLSLIRIHPDVQLGRPQGVNMALEAVEQELRQIAADEMARSNVGNENSTQGNQAKGSDQKGKDKGKGKGKQAEAKGNPPKETPKGKGKSERPHKPDKPEKPSAEPKKKCIFHKRKSGCRFGDACNYVHEGPSGASQGNQAQGTQRLRRRMHRRERRRRLQRQQQLPLFYPSPA